MKHPVPKLPKRLQVEFRRGAWTDAGGLGCLTVLAQRWGLPEHLQQAVQVKKRHRGKQGHENVFKGLLRELDLHHPPCRTLKANRAYYALAQLAQLLLIGAKYELLPKEAHGVGLRRLIRHWVRCAGQGSGGAARSALGAAIVRDGVEAALACLRRSSGV